MLLLLVLCRACYSRALIHQGNIFYRKIFIFFDVPISESNSIAPLRKEPKCGAARTTGADISLILLKLTDEFTRCVFCIIHNPVRTLTLLKTKYHMIFLYLVISLRIATR